MVCHKNALKTTLLWCTTNRPKKTHYNDRAQKLQNYGAQQTTLKKLQYYCGPPKSHSETTILWCATNRTQNLQYYGAQQTNKQKRTQKLQYYGAPQITLKN